MAAPAAAPAKPATNGTTPGRMSIASLIRTAERGPDRILLVGVEGIGKTTFAAEAGAVFICAEDGIPVTVGEVPRFPPPKTLDDVLEAVRSLIRDPHDFRVLAIDTVDWLEPIIWKDLCTKNHWEDIESPGYGKGYVAAAEEWRRLLAALDVLRERRGMEIILLAHASIKTFQNPAGGDYARYECKLNKSAAALIREWCDTNLFAIHEEHIVKVKGKETRKAQGTGRRVVKTERTPAWDAKNRWALPPELPLSYPDYVAARAAGKPADPTALLKEAEELVGQLRLSEKDLNQTKDAIEKARTAGAAHLARVVDRLRSKVAEQGVEL